MRSVNSCRCQQPTVEELDELCAVRGTQLESLICGYLRQPIATNPRSGSVRVTGSCALTDKCCYLRVVDGKQGYVVLECPVYRARYLLPTAT
jgi:hypothetical protein